ncbi:sigma intracellular receptor 2 isoform X1 [Cetorhinus maximus]
MTATNCRSKHKRKILPMLDTLNRDGTETGNSDGGASDRKCAFYTLFQLQGLLKWYAARFKDPMIMDPPAWFKAFILCEALLQMPFFPVAAYAFYKGGCSWIRTPAIIYSTHVATTVIPILAHILFNDFSASTYPGPKTMSERLSLLAIYTPYLLIPVWILLTMLFSETYNPDKEKKRR